MKLKRIYQEMDYPLMRDPVRNPKCYEMTDQERAEAARRVEQLLEEVHTTNEQGYYGA